MVLDCRIWTRSTSCSHQPDLRTGHSEPSFPIEVESGRRLLNRIRSALVVAVALTGCETAPVVNPVEHAAEVEEWQAARRATLMQTDGWLTLVALHWLDDSETTLGSDPASDLVYTGSDTPARVGTFHLENGLVAWESAEGVRVTTAGGGEPVSYAVMNPADADPLVLEAWPLQWLVVKRGDRFAIRLKDAQSVTRTEFDGIKHFPVMADWKVPARFELRETPDTILVPNVLGTVNKTPSPARVVFEVDGEARSLDLWKDSDDPENFFTAFGDETNGTSSYGGGRFIWIDAPDEEGRTWIDFNKAYNPPCVFTEFATCPLPPEQNRISTAITAGELVYAKEG